MKGCRFVRQPFQNNRDGHRYAGEGYAVPDASGPERGSMKEALEYEDRVPGEHDRLYRLLTPEGTVVWAHPTELVRKRGSGEGCIMQK